MRSTERQLIVHVNKLTKPPPIIEAPPILEALPEMSNMLDVPEAPLFLKKIFKIFKNFFGFSY